MSLMGPLDRHYKGPSLASSYNEMGDNIFKDSTLMGNKKIQCMSSTRSEYSKLGLELVSLEDNHSHTPNKPSMVE